jgi:hypothetical protein
MSSRERRLQLMRQQLQIDFPNPTWSFAAETLFIMYSNINLALTPLAPAELAALYTSRRRRNIPNCFLVFRKLYQNAIRLQFPDKQIPTISVLSSLAWEAGRGADQDRFKSLVQDAKQYDENRRNYPRSFRCRHCGTVNIPNGM